MQIRAIDLREIHLPLRFPFITSRGRTEKRRIILVRVEDENGVEGWGECTSPEEPFYTEEWVDGSWLALHDFLGPLLVGRFIDHPADAARCLASVRGHRMAKAALENACWHLEAERRAVPLSRLLGGSRSSVAAGVTVGLQPSLAALFEKIEGELAAGYLRIKLKIERGNDIGLIEKVRDRFPDAPLMVDANGAYEAADLSLLRQLDAFNLMMFEQPFAPGDLAAHAGLQRILSTPVCLDESIVSSSEASLAIELGACRIINVKAGRVGGLSAAIEIERICRDRGIEAWCGGMLESGIGRAHNIALASLEGFSFPNDVSASSRYWDEDVIDPPVRVDSEGMVSVPQSPGLGFVVNRGRIEYLTSRIESLKI